MNIFDPPLPNPRPPSQSPHAYGKPGRHHHSGGKHDIVKPPELTMKPVGCHPFSQSPAPNSQQQHHEQVVAREQRQIRQKFRRRRGPRRASHPDQAQNQQQDSRHGYSIRPNRAEEILNGERRTKNLSDERHHGDQRIRIKVPCCPHRVALRKILHDRTPAMHIDVSGTGFTRAQFSSGQSWARCPCSVETRQCGRPLMPRAFALPQYFAYDLPHGRDCKKTAARREL